LVLSWVSPALVGALDARMGVTAPARSAIDCHCRLIPSKQRIGHGSGVLVALAGPFSFTTAFAGGRLLALVARRSPL
jgi:hypothetical protein